MTAAANFTRRRFIARSASTAFALGVMGRRAFGATAFPQLEMPEKIFLRSWDAGDFSLYLKFKDTHGGARAIRVTATNGAVGYVPHWVSRGSVSGSNPVVWATDGGLSDKTVSILRETNLLDHELVHDRLVAAGTAGAELSAADIACWDLHARMLGRPLHALLGTQRIRALRYGDVRGEAVGFNPQAYADRVAEYLKRNNLRATKLHFPGAMRTAESIPFDVVKETLRRIRATVGPEAILAYDPYPRSAESATASMAEARELLALLSELNYAWVEGPLIPEPETTQRAKYAELMRGVRVRIQPEGPGEIGDLTDFATIRRWAEAGAADQFSTDCYYRDGLTPLVRLIAWVKANPGRNMTLNLHWSWLPHIHLAMACDDAIYPLVELPMSSEIPPALFANSPFVQAPEWPGIYLRNA